MCRNWDTFLHPKRYGSLNKFCSEYEPESTTAPSLGDLARHMQAGILYGIFYNDFGDPSKLVGILDLRSREFIDGHPDDWKAEHGYA